MSHRFAKAARLGRLAASAAVVVFVAGLIVGPSWSYAQGVTTGAIAGLVLDAEQQPVRGAGVSVIHQPSGTQYEGVTGPDGRFFIPGMRVGGPYTVTVFHAGTGVAFEPQVLENVFVNLGVVTDLRFTVQPVKVEEQITVTGTADPVFSSSRTGSATSVSREVLESLPTIARRLSDITRLTPETSGYMSFGGQDNRLNNITVDGSYFNNSFGLAGTPGDRTGVAPISLDAIEQIQVSIAPFDVRQGNFVGANVNTVTRSGTNQLRGSFYHQVRDERLVGTRAGAARVNPGTFDFRNTGGWVSGPVVRNRTFFFGNVEIEDLTQPATTFRANRGGEPVGGNVTRVLASDLDRLSSFLKANFNYDTGPYEGYDDKTPARRYLIKADHNLNARNKLTVRYNHLDSEDDVLVSNSSSLGFGNRRSTTLALNFRNSNYKIMENIRSVVGEWNSIVADNKANRLIAGFSYHDESRKYVGTLFPFVDILEGGSTYTSFGFEPFTPNNELRYGSFQVQNDFSWYSGRHTLVFGGTAERYRSDNVFFPGSQSIYVYNSLADFYADANGYLADPNRTISPVVLRRFQVRWMNIPGMDKPLQPLEVFYAGAYAQDEWHASGQLNVTLGVRFDVPVFGDTGYANADADSLTFRDETGAPVRYSTKKLPDPKILWSPRLGFNWNVRGQQRTQVRGGTGLFTGRPAYVWISNQIGNTGVLTGFEQLDNTRLRPFHPEPNRYKPAVVTGAPAASYELALTDPDFKFPQLWRTNLALDQRLAWGWRGTVELIYSRDINGIYYINANLPEPNARFVGPDARPRWTAGNRIHRHVANAIVLKNQNVGRSWTISTSAERPLQAGLWVKAAYSYGQAKNTVNPGSIAFGSWNNNPHAGDPNNPGLGFADNSPGHRFFVAASYSRQYLRWGATTVAVYWESRTEGNASYTFSGDLNGDGGTSNDLIYIPRDLSEMNFQPFTVGSRTFSAEEQAQAWNAFIEQDPYLRKHRGQYAQRGAVFLPLVHRMDLSVSQDFFVSMGGKRHTFQLRADVLNFANLLNKNWGVGRRFVTTQPLIVPTVAQGGPADAQGRAQYRLRVIGGELIRRSIERSAGLGDVYRVQVSLRYLF